MSSSDVAESANSSIAEILAKLGADPKTGLDSAQLQERLSNYGPNALPEEKKKRARSFARLFLGADPVDD